MPPDREVRREEDHPDRGHDRAASTTGMIRGSSLLLLGKVISVGLGLVIQVLIVRYLSQSDYGAFAFALATAMLFANLGVLGMDKTLARFLPIHDEDRRPDLAAGALLLAAALILATGTVTVVGMIGLRDWLDATVIGDPLATTVLVVMIFLAPLMAFDSVLLSVFAVLASPLSIFVRRHVVAPLLQLTAVGVVIFLGLGVLELAVGYLLASLIGLVVYGLILFRLVAERGWIRAFRGRRSVQWRELLGYTAPLMSSDVVFLLTTHLAVVLVQALRTSEEVALFRAVFPVAQQNLLVMNAFTLLFTPVAARMFARRDGRALNELYWQSAIWMAILGFPLFVLTFSLAGPVAELLFGPEYAPSGPILAWLSFGYFLSAAFGFNVLTLRVYGRVRYIVTVDLVTAVGGTIATVLLILAFGPLGAAIGVAATLIAQSVLYQIGLRATEVHPFPRQHAALYAAAIGMPLVLVGLIAAFDLGVVPSLVLGGLLAVSLPIIARRALNLTEFFPELERVPLLHWLLR
jgi:O-antigen/teichoic acid export membrane protein